MNREIAAKNTDDFEDTDMQNTGNATKVSTRLGVTVSLHSLVGCCPLTVLQLLLLLMVFQSLWEMFKVDLLSNRKPSESDCCNVCP